MFFTASETPKISTEITEEPSKLLIEKPRTLAETCPVEIQIERLPLIEEFRKKKEGKKKIVSNKEDGENTLKTSLPKLKSNEVSQQKVGAGESVGMFTSDSTPWKARQVSGSRQTSEAVVSESAKISENVRQCNLQNEPNFGLSQCRSVIKVPSSELQLEDVEVLEEKLEESNSLKRWEFWVKDKKYLQKRISQKLGRNPCFLQIQESDKYRQKMEEKSLLEYAQIPIPDKWRGNYFRWKTGIKIGQNRRKPLNCKSEQTMDFCAVKSKTEEGIIPEMEFIGIPKSIRAEKGLVCRSRNSTVKESEKTSYRQERLWYYRKQIQRLKPHEILMNDLEIIGQEIFKTKDEGEEQATTQKLPEIVVTLEEAEQKNYVDDRQSIFCLAINGEEVKCDYGTDYCQDSDKILSWNVDFQTNTVGSFVENILEIENRGTMAVKYDWLPQKIDKKQSLKKLCSARYEPWFFFNKNSGVFLPGQIYSLKFYLHAKSPGIRKEIWHLKTSPPFPRNSGTGRIVLSAVVTDDVSNEENPLDLFLCKRVRDSVVAFALDVILYKVFSFSEVLRELEYRSIFNEKDLFEYHNPKHYHHSVIVRELKKLFKKIPLGNQSEWDLSLNTLITLIKTFKTGQEKDLLLYEVAAYAKKLLRPNYLPVKDDRKYKMSYEILCKMANFMEEDYDYIKNLFSQKKEQTVGRIWSEFEESEEFISSSSLNSEEMGEVIRNTISLITNPVHLLHFQTMFYIKVYHRVCEAAEQVAGVIETNKLFQPWKQVNAYPGKPYVIRHSLVYIK